MNTNELYITLPGGFHAATGPLHPRVVTLVNSMLTAGYYPVYAALIEGGHLELAFCECPPELTPTELHELVANFYREA